MLNPESMPLRRVGENQGSVEYWNRTVVVDPSGLTDAWSVAPTVETEVAALVMTTGSVLSRVLPSSSSMVKARRRVRWERRVHRRGVRRKLSVGEVFETAK